MAFTKNYINELIVIVLVLSSTLSAVSAVDCNGKSFHCANSTHFMICVDVGGGVSQAIDNFYIACPPPTVCQGTNHFECEFPAPTTPATTLRNVNTEATLAWEEIVTSSSLDNTTKEFSENYMDTTEYSVTTDTTLDVSPTTASNVLINNELNVTEIVPTIVVETTTPLIDTIPQSISKDENITEIRATTEDVTRTVKDIVSNVGAESATIPIDTIPQSIGENVRTTESTLTAEHVTETVPVILTEITTIIPQTITEEQNITGIPIGDVTDIVTPGIETVTQTTFETQNSTEAELEKSKTTAVEINTQTQSENVVTTGTVGSTPFTTEQMTKTTTNNYDLEPAFSSTDLPQVTTLMKEESVTNNTLLKESSISNQDSQTITNINISVNVKAGEAQPNSISQNLNETSRIKSAVETTTASTEQLIGTPVDKNVTEINQDSSTALPLDPKLHNLPTLPSTKPYSFGLNKDKPVPVKLEGSIKSNSSSVTTKEPPTYKVENPTPQMTKVNNTVHKIIPTIGEGVNAPSKKTTENGPSSDETTTIYEEYLIKDSTQYVVTENPDLVTTEAIDITSPNSNIQPVTTQISFFSTETSQSEGTEFGGSFAIEAFENTITTEQPTALNEHNEHSVTIDTTQAAVDNIIPISEAVNRIFTSTDRIYDSTTFDNAQAIMTGVTSLAPKTQISADKKLIKTAEYTGTTNQPTTINEQSLTIDPNQNIVQDNTGFTTSAVEDLGTVWTETTYDSTTTNIAQLMITKAPSLVEEIKNTDDAKLNTNLASNEQTTIINEETVTLDYSAHATTEKTIIVTSHAVPTSISNIPSIPTNVPLSITKLPNPEDTKQDAITMITQSMDSGNIIEQPTTTNEENSTTDTIGNVAPEDIIISIGHAEDVTTEIVYTPPTKDHLIPDASEDNMSEQDQLLTTQTPVEQTNLDRALITEAIGNSVTLTPINEESVKTNIQNVASIVSNAQPMFEDKMNAKGSLIPSENKASMPEINNDTSSKNVVTSNPINLKQTNLVSSGKKLVINGQGEAVEQTTDTYLLPPITEIGLHFNKETVVGNIHGETITSKTLITENIDVGTTEALSIPSDTYDVSVTHNTVLNSGMLNESEYNRQIIPNQIIHKSETNTAQIINHSPLQPIIAERNDQVPNKYLNPLDNYLIDKTNQNSESTRISTATNLNVKQGGMDAVGRDTQFVSQQPTMSLHTGGPIPVESNNREQSYNAATVTRNSIGLLNANGLLATNELGNRTEAYSEPEIDTLPTFQVSVQVKEDYITPKTDTFGQTLPMSTTILTKTTVAETTMPDSVQNKYETVTKSFSLGSATESVGDATGSNIESIESIESDSNVFHNKKQSENPKNNHIPIIDNLPKTNDNKAKAQISSAVIGHTQSGQSITNQNEIPTNSQDFSESTSVRITTRGDNTNENVDAPKKPVMLDVLPLPVNNDKWSSPVVNIPDSPDLKSKTQSENIVVITESYKSATSNPTLVYSRMQASVSGIDITTTSSIGIQNSNIQVAVTDKASHDPQNPASGGSNSVSNSQTGLFDTNNDIMTVTVSTFEVASSNSLTGVVGTAKIPAQHLQVEHGPLEQTSASNNVHVTSHAEQTEIEASNFQNPVSVVTQKSVSEVNNQTNKSMNSVPEGTVNLKRNSTIPNDSKYTTLSNSEKESQQTNLHKTVNLPPSTQTQKTYTSTVRTPSQSITPNSISDVTNNLTKEVPTAASISFNCIIGTRGRYSDKDDCRKFYICVGNSKQPIIGNCPENTVFSDFKKLCTKNISQCIRENEFKCPWAGRFSDYMKDNVYYICVDHKNHLYRLKFQCQKGYILNKTTVKCIETKEIESNESVSISSGDNSSQTDSTSTNSNDTNMNGISTSGKSTSSSGGDDSSSKNVYSSKVQTKEGEESPEKSEGKEDDEEEKVFKCTKKGKFPIRNECRRYYLCKKNRREYRRKIKKCDSDRVFNKDRKKCVDADSYEC